MLTFLQLDESYGGPNLPFYSLQFAPRSNLLVRYLLSSLAPLPSEIFLNTGGVKVNNIPKQTEMERLS